MRASWCSRRRSSKQPSKLLLSCMQALIASGRHVGWLTRASRYLLSCVCYLEVAGPGVGAVQAPQPAPQQIAAVPGETAVHVLHARKLIYIQASLLEQQYLEQQEHLTALVVDSIERWPRQVERLEDDLATETNQLELFQQQVRWRLRWCGYAGQASTMVWVC